MHPQFKRVPAVVPLLDSANRDRVTGTGVCFCPVATVLGKILVVRLEDIVFDPQSRNDVEGRIVDLDIPESSGRQATARAISANVFSSSISTRLLPVLRVTRRQGGRQAGLIGDTDAGGIALTELGGNGGNALLIGNGGNGDIPAQARGRAAQAPAVHAVAAKPNGITG